MPRFINRQPVSMVSSAVASASNGANVLSRGDPLEAAVNHPDREYHLRISRQATICCAAVRRWPRKAGASAADAVRCCASTANCNSRQFAG
jgi:hypothetical protein